MKRFARMSLALPFAFLALHASASSYEEGVRLKEQQQLAPAAEVFADLAAREPRNTLAREQLAIVLGWQNRFDESIAAWQEAIALSPDKPDYHLGLARVNYWKGDLSAALYSLDTALSLDESQAEALKLKGDVLLADRRAAEARSAYEQAQVLAPADAEIGVKLARIVEPLLWRLDTGFIYDKYDNFRGEENSRFVQLGRRVGNGGDVLYVRYDGYDNFGSQDNGATLGAYWLPHPRVLLNLEAGATLGEADFRPNTLFLVSGEWLVDFLVQPLLAYRYFDYDNGTVTTITPGLRVAFNGGHFEARYGITDNISGSSTGVFAGKLTLFRKGYRPYLAYTAGSEALPPQAEADITVLGGGVVIDLSPRWGARVDYSYEDRKNIYQHHAVGTGLTYRF